MADMRLVVAGAGGRMGRTLVKAIADSKGFALAGALEDARSPLIGWDAGTLAGERRQAQRRRRPAARGR
jgi:4-hydroxy-tetrahydrodipicolinate reductase